MELSNFTLHVFAILAVVLAAGVVAFVCDLLKGTVDKLRVQNAELRALQREVLVQALPAPAALPVAMPAVVVAPAAVAESPAPKPAAPAQAEPAAEAKPNQAKPKMSVREAVERGKAMAAASGVAPAAASAGRRHNGRTRREVTWATPDELMQFAMGGPRRGSQRDEEESSSLPAHAEPLRTAQAEAVAEHSEQATVAAAASGSPARHEEEEAAAATALAGTVRTLHVVHRSEPRPAAANGPRGHADRAAFSRLKRATERFTGSVLVVAVDNFRQIAERLGKGGAEEELASLWNLLEAAAGDNGFFCRSEEDEFVLVSYDLGAAAKRRLDSLTEQLWDHQLRNLGGNTLSFRWGAAQGNSEEFGDVYAEAQSRTSQSVRPGNFSPQAPVKIAVGA